MEWHYTENGQQAGPVSEADFNGLVQSGRISAQTLVWKAGMENWKPYGEVQGAPSVVGEAVMKCAECGKEFSTNDMIQYQNSWICAACKPVFFQKVKEGALIPGTLVYAGFWIRFGAKFLDGLIQQVVGFVIGLVGGSIAGASGKDEMGILATILIYFFSIGFGIAYNTWFIGKFGATPGKMACKLKVVRPDGSPVSYMRALGRHFAEMLSGLILLMGYIMAAFDEEKRALHDRICDTRVVIKQ